MENALDKVPQRYRDELYGDLLEVWSSQTWTQAKLMLEQKALKWSKINYRLGDFLSEEGLDTLTV